LPPDRFAATGGPVPDGYGAPPPASTLPRPPRPRSAAGSEPPRPSFPLIPALIAVLTVAAMAMIGAPLARQVVAHADDKPASVADVPAGANAAVVAAAPAANCLVGTWRENKTDFVIRGAHFVGSGAVVRFKPDGTVTAQYPGLTYRAKVADRNLDLVISGAVTYRYAATAEAVSYSGISYSRGTKVSVAGVTVDAHGSQVRAVSPDRYTCTAAKLVLSGEAYSEFVRAG
jgi:hypothetical protein